MSHTIHTALQRRPSTPSESPATMWTSQRDTGGKWAYNTPHSMTAVAIPGGPCALSLPSRWSSVPRSYTPPAPSLHWGKSHYTCVPLPDVEIPPPDLRQYTEFPRLAGFPDAQPHPLRPIALPSQIPGVTSVTLNPALAKSRPLVAVDLASTPNPEGNAAWHQPATYPELPSLTIISSRLPWAITAHAGRTRRCVTVADILGAISEALRLPVDKEDFKDWVTMTQSGGYCPKGGLITHHDGMTRRDLLQGRTRFAGLVPSTMGCDIWVLEVV
ncbi:hypothetical protein DFH09DRAFT_1158240 [Mycena vulgaris]|nr:hypothetical protein DFH09DRAFT_1158240 [Mycena vulgaris]